MFFLLHPSKARLQIRKGWSVQKLNKYMLKKKPQWNLHKVYSLVNSITKVNLLGLKIDDGYGRCYQWGKPGVRVKLLYFPNFLWVLKVFQNNKLKKEDTASKELPTTCLPPSNTANCARELKMPAIQSPLTILVSFHLDSAFQDIYQVEKTFICFYKNVKFQFRRISQHRSGSATSRNI